MVQEEYTLFINKLISIWTIVNDWLKYAETKNTAILTFSSVSITIIVTYLSTVEKIYLSLKLGLTISVVLLFVSAFFSIVSFLPNTDTNKYLYKVFHQSKDRPSDSDIFYHFGDLRKYLSIDGREPTAKSLIKAITSAYFSHINNDEEFILKESGDLCKQIITNSNITFQKLKISTWSIRIIISSMLIIPLSMLSSLILKHHF